MSSTLEFIIENGEFERFGKHCSSTRNSSFNDCSERIIERYLKKYDK